MVQIIKEGPRKLTIGQKLAGGLEKGLRILNDRAAEERQFERQMQLQQMKGEQDFSNQLKLNESKKFKTPEELQFDKENYDTMNNAFGREFADVWKGSTEGGKTTLLKKALEAKERGLDIREMLRDEGEKNLTEQEERGITSAEKFQRQESRYAKNLPLYEESRKQHLAYEAENDALGILEELNPEISTFDKFNIDPQSGELVIPQLASPSAQRYAKTINDYLTRAKETFGARVTNFDIVAFMKRLPSLANSQEGRRQILDQMKLINKINIEHSRALQDVIDEKGGIRKIDWDKAERLAESKSKDKISQYKSAFHEIDKKISKTEKGKESEFKSKTPKGRIAVQTPDGRYAHIKTSDLRKFLRQYPGGKAL